LEEHENAEDAKNKIRMKGAELFSYIWHLFLTDGINTIVQAPDDVKPYKQRKPIDSLITDCMNIKTIKNIERWSLELFNKDKIKEFIDKWIPDDTSLGAAGNKNETYNLFVSNKYLYRLAENPYTFSLALFYKSTWGKEKPNDILSYIIRACLKTQRSCAISTKS
jgi:hypothetical protein